MTVPTADEARLRHVVDLVKGRRERTEAAPGPAPVVTATWVMSADGVIGAAPEWDDEPPTPAGP
ncbi:hypothetical protein ACQPZF_23535 [Actinosynnema sp. CS-041913]|uniref:hypothetical protein n=1 Tax=Actinosynnema sp. CS-041913 TaxID=3239917 RepID=UPI003D8C8C89